MLKKIITFILLSLVLAGAGFIAGRTYDSISWINYLDNSDTNKKELLRRIEEYQPSCKELKHRGLPILKKVKGDYIVIVTDKNELLTVGINTDHELTVVSWSSSDLNNAIKETCGKQSLKKHGKIEKGV